MKKIGEFKMVNKLKMFYYKIFNLNEKVCKFPKLIFKNKEWKNILNYNAKYKNIHKGQRCFILGNGPSLKTDDLRQLENEFVFSVNQIARHPDFEYIKPTYHFWADPHFFEIDENKPEDLELINTMKKVKTDESFQTKCTEKC